jgi:hypothetical protein
VIVLGASVVVAGSTAGSALAGPPDRAQDVYDPFVCPVLTVSEQAAANSGKFNSLGDGEYTFAPGNAGTTDFNGNVPLLATNGGGTGTPGVDHASPGDSDYTAIWSGEGA